MFLRVVEVFRVPPPVVSLQNRVAGLLYDRGWDGFADLRVPPPAVSCQIRIGDFIL